jgi:hypothetical protein
MVDYWIKCGRQLAANSGRLEQFIKWAAMSNEADGQERLNSAVAVGGPLE